MTGRFNLSRAALPVLVPMLACSVLGVAAPLSAQSQDSVSRAVVQPLPPAAVSDLNTALLRGEVVSVIPIVAASPVFTMLLSIFVFHRETLTPRIVMAVLVVVPSVIFIALNR